MDNIIVKIVAQSETDEAIKDLDKLKQKEAEIERQMGEIKKKSNDFLGAPKVVAALDKEFQKLDADLKKTKQSISEYSKGLKTANDQVANNAVGSQRLTTQLRNMKNELAKMEAEGIDPSDKALYKLGLLNPVS